MIKFGTSGWRAIIADEFTFKNVTAVSRAIARHLKKRVKRGAAKSIKVAIGCDTRFLSEKFSGAAASALKEEGIHPIVLQGFAPTPVIAFTVINKKWDGGINITASHNPPEWSGIKFTTERGAPAPLDVTKEIENLVSDILRSEELPVMPVDAGDHPVFDPLRDYSKRLQDLIDLRSIAKSKVRIGVDPMFGAGISFMRDILTRNGIKFEMIHDRRDTRFGGKAPDPSEANLAELRTMVVSKKMDLGIALDGDADRFGFIDRDGSYANPNLILGLLADYLIRSRGWKSGVGLTVATGHLMKEVARKNGIPVFVTPVGFKYLGDLITDGKAFIVGEESAGMSIQGHIPEKDGILATLLVLEMVATQRKSLKQLRNSLFRKVGGFYNERVNIPVSREIMDKFDEKLKNIPDKVARQLVRDIDRMDGIKILFKNGSWILYRRSGTEPVVRLYAEAHTEDELARLVSGAKKFLLSD